MIQVKKPNEEMSRAGRKSVADYLALPYSVEVFPIPAEEGGGYNASIPLLGRYAAQGDGETAAAAIADLYLHLPSLLEEWLREGVDIPEPGTPAEEAGFSGRMMLRVPKTLHARVARRAQTEGVSINQFIAVTLAQEVGTGR